MASHVDISPSSDPSIWTLWLPFAIIIAVILALMVYVLWFPPPPPAEIREGVTGDLSAGYGSLGSIGNPEGLNPGEVVDYATPAGVAPDKLLFAGSWRNDESAMTHVGGKQGLVMAGFSASHVEAQMAPGDLNSEVLIFYDGNFVTGSLAGKDVGFDGMRSFVNVTASRGYDVLKGIPPGKHLIIIAADDDAFSFKGFSFY